MYYTATVGTTAGMLQISTHGACTPLNLIIHGMVVYIGTTIYALWMGSLGGEIWEAYYNEVFGEEAKEAAKLRLAANRLNNSNVGL